ncbi:glycosyltransferase [Anaeromyxobacter paludicola]|uniref:Glycosyltransferase subfamily 4-like N-terminal domain-containing protein n=1 Tax=Anaeromyxobacter paludicola TaxID=2918171 RepID=A0ABM7X8M7_9BACT|nr:glycosyltransferase [Anaeromyxobacter paludicola]BDG08186.1 hypothetical protein AMPC_12990 [Anaeromyxobacter paludicola]
MTGPRKVLVFQNRFLYGGQERQTLLHLRTLDRRRWEPLVACFKAEGEHLAELRALEVPVVEIPIRSLASAGTALEIRRLAARIRRERIALVHAQDFFTNVVGTFAARLAGVPSVVTRVDLAHALDPVRYQLLRAASHLATRVLVNALCIRDLCLRDGVDPSKLVVLRNGLDLAAFDAAAAAPPGPGAPEPGGPLVVNVANMHHPVKGQPDLLQAMRLVLRELPEARLALIGGGARRPALEAQAARLGIAGRVSFLGHRADVPALVARSAVVVSASYAEGISNAVLEGMAARRAVVATAVGGTPELVRDGVTGWLAPPGAPAALAARIRGALRDPIAARRVGQAARRLVAAEFGVEEMRAAYDALYESLAGADAAPPSRWVAAPRRPPAAPRRAEALPADGISP